MNIRSKLPKSEVSIFSTMSALSRKHDAINLAQGFPDFDCDDKLKVLVSKYLHDNKNQYAPMAGLLELRETICQKLFRSHHIELSAETQVCVTAGATQALFTAIQAFVHQGDEVIIIEPAYDCYRPSIIIAGGVPRPYQLTYPDYSIDWNEIENMVNDKTKMIIINTPHNPTGTILHQSDLETLEAIVADKDIIVLSDEVYEHLIYDNEQHESVMRFPKLFEQSLAVFSFGKTFHATGWKMGYCVGAAHLMKEFKNIHQWNVFSVNSFVQYALAEHLKDSSTYDYLPNFFQQKRDFLAEKLENTPLIPIKTSGTYFQLYHYGSISDKTDIDFAKYLTREIGVAGIPLSPFYTKPVGDKVVRLCFAKQEKTLAAAAERLAMLK